ncbi:MAG: zinc-binding dehydrogenase [Leptolyngbyaceae cyanobacterium CSU_1_3]|nr:zinc-binding dehydrogenase [Leptolyngbyaceae cyanobacterium CSU_1_3]
MKALILEKPGTPDTFYVSEMPEPQPDDGEVRIKVYAVGLNPADYKFALRGMKAWTYPWILGLDVAGVIDAIGSNVTNWKIGDAVYYHGNLAKPGGFAEYTIASSHAIAPLPKNLSFPEAAALPCSGFTAYQVLHRKLHLQAGQTILIHGGAGGVGGFAIQLAAIAQLNIFTTCSAKNVDWVRKLGATHSIDYTLEDVPAMVAKLTHGRGVDGIIDTVGSDSATTGLGMLAFGGGIACVNGLPDFSQMRSFGKALSVHDVALGGAYLENDLQAQQDLAQIGQAFGELVSRYQLNPMLDEVIRLEDIPQALVRLSQRHVRGKIVAQIQE